MKISAINVTSNIRANKSQKTNKNISFTSGLPYSFVRHVDQLDVRSVENKFAQSGIITNFNGSKVVAACTEKTAEIYRKYGLALPKKIEFTPIEDSDALGKCIYGNSHIQINSNHREFYDINLLNKLEESQDSFHPTKHFLATFIHEFAHNAHFQNILKFNNLDDAKSIMSYFNTMQIRPFWTKVQGNGEYSTYSANEYMAELITRKIVENLDENLNLKSAPILNIFRRAETSYQNPFPNLAPLPSNGFIWEQGVMGAMQNTNRAIWNGDLESLKTHGYGIKGQITVTDVTAGINTIKSIWDFLKG